MMICTKLNPFILFYFILFATLITKNIHSNVNVSVLVKMQRKQKSSFLCVKIVILHSDLALMLLEWLTRQQFILELWMYLSFTSSVCDSETLLHQIYSFI